MSLKKKLKTALVLTIIGAFATLMYMKPIDSDDTASLPGQQSEPEDSARKSSPIPSDTAVQTSVKAEKKNLPPPINYQEKTLTSAQKIQLKQLWQRCNNIKPLIRIEGCNGVINAGLEYGEALLLAYSNRASAYGEKQKYESALKDYSFILQNNPKNFSAYINRGDIFQLTNKFDQAIKDYSDAIVLKKTDYNVYLSRAWAYYQLSKVNHGLVDLDKAIQIAPNNSELFATRGQFYETIGKNVEAAQNYRRSLKLNPDLIEAKDGLKRTAPRNR